MLIQRFCRAMLLALLTLAAPSWGQADTKPAAAGIDANTGILASLDKSSTIKTAFSKDEASLLLEAKGGTLRSFADATLIASGVLDGAKRKSYLARIDVLETEARKELACCASTKDKGETLLKFLHRRAMTGGYSLKQSNLAVVLDEGKFNCVSSALLYNIIARRLGLEVRGVEIPGHVYAVLLEGSERAAVETTHPAGFNPVWKSPAGRDVGDSGLVALVYFNRGVELLEEQRYHEAVRANFQALCLDRELANARKNLKAALGRWNAKLAEAGKFDEALNVATVALELVPGDADLKDNVVITYDEWARNFMKAKQFAKAVEVYEKGLVQVPGASSLENNVVVTYDQWARGLLEAGQVAEAIQVYERALQRFPQDGVLRNNLTYCQQQMSRLQAK